MPRSQVIRVGLVAVAVLVGSLLAAYPATASPARKLAGAWSSSAGLGALPPTATAAATRRTMYTGSTSPSATPMNMEVGKSRIGQIAVQYDTPCFAYTSVLHAATLRRAKLRRGGRFTVSVNTSLVDSQRVFWNGERQPDKIVEKFTGRITRKSARGSVRATLTFLDGSTCTTGTQRWLLTHAPGRMFGGLTSQSMPVSVELSSSKKRITHLHIGWLAPCPDGSAWVIPDFLTNFTLTSGQVDEAFQQEYPDIEGGMTRYDYRLSARVGQRTSTGTLNVTVSSIDATGAVQAACSTPTVTWTARS
jgi:hypothetical protein